MITTRNVRLRAGAASEAAPRAGRVEHAPVRPRNRTSAARTDGPMCGSREATTARKDGTGFRITTCDARRLRGTQLRQDTTPSSDRCGTLETAREDGTGFRITTCDARRSRGTQFRQHTTPSSDRCGQPGDRPEPGTLTDTAQHCASMRPRSARHELPPSGIVDGARLTPETSRQPRPMPATSSCVASP